jgi:hypothetical protein
MEEENISIAYKLGECTLKPQEKVPWMVGMTPL